MSRQMYWGNLWVGAFQEPVSIGIFSWIGGFSQKETLQSVDCEAGEKMV